MLPSHPILFFHNVFWMGWNAVLGLLPFLLSIILFKPKTRITHFWILSFFIFYIFLPNAPYIFTDIIHLRTASLKVPDNVSFYAVAVQYVVFLLLGALMFVVSFKRFENFALRRLKMNKQVFRIANFLFISAGIYLGRFDRLNSWDIITNPVLVIHSLLSLLTIHALLYIATFTAVLFLVYFVSLHLTLSSRKSTSTKRR